MDITEMLVEVSAEEKGTPKWKCKDCRYFKRDFCKILLIATTMNGYCIEYYESRTTKSKKEEYNA